ncbi:DNA/RNA non-specific endonuclease [Halosquirtibacter laminarini]|uniref:DNA/RNA non-specific endonuclease n=1 Tax=Halosquirtibacter laminarini TaxID=3374600 RepID=A0AC61NMT8_9BACT|nr:DNA/RNA non-specific endonuclease [Prolixibacteraceae bacterium]
MNKIVCFAIIILLASCKTSLKEGTEYFTKNPFKKTARHGMERVTKVGFKSIDQLIHSGEYVIKGGKKRFKILNKSGDELASVIKTSKEMRVNASWVSKGSKAHSLNALLNTKNLLPNTTYTANGAKYITDDLCRPLEASISSFAKANRVPRNANMQRKALYDAIGAAEAKHYQGGHMIANSLGGISEGINIVPQFEYVNKTTFWKVEKYVSEHRKSVKHYKVRNIYKGDSRIPYSQRITFEIRGKKHAYFIQNTQG